MNTEFKYEGVSEFQSLHDETRKMEERDAFVDAVGPWVTVGIVLGFIALYVLLGGAVIR